MADLDMSEYKEEFINEAKEHLQNMNEALLDLEHAPDDMDLLNRVFRSAHTLKGSSATMGYTKVAELTHKMENVLDEIRNHRLVVTSDILDLVFESFDALETLVDDIDEDRESELDIDGFVSRLVKLTEEAGEVQTEVAKEVREVIPDLREVKIEDTENLAPTIALTEADKRAVDAAINEGLDVLKIAVTVEEGCALKGVRAFMVVKKLKGKGIILASIPPVEKIENGDFEGDFISLLGIHEGDLKYAELSLEIANMNEIAGAVVEKFVVTIAEYLGDVGVPKVAHDAVRQIDARRNVAVRLDADIRPACTASTEVFSDDSRLGPAAATGVRARGFPRIERSAHQADPAKLRSR